MSQVSCPSCKRKGTYSEKHKQCAACGLGYEATLGELPKVEKPVTERVTVTANVTKREDVTGIVTADAPCEHCGCPGHKKPKSTAERQRAYRERNA